MGSQSTYKGDEIITKFFEVDTRVSVLEEKFISLKESLDIVISKIDEIKDHMVTNNIYQKEQDKIDIINLRLSEHISKTNLWQDEYSLKMKSIQDSIIKSGESALKNSFYLGKFSIVWWLVSIVISSIVYYFFKNI